MEPSQVLVASFNSKYIEMIQLVTKLRVEWNVSYYCYTGFVLKPRLRKKARERKLHVQEIKE